MRPKKFLKSVVKFLVAIAALLAITRFCHEKTGKFELYKISSDLPFSQEWDTGTPSAEKTSELKKIFDQPFRFIGKGGQAFVFGSDDGKYVIKFFRISRLEPPLWLKAINLPYVLESYRARVTLEKRAQLNHDFQSYYLAWKEMREETGLIFCHLNKTDFLRQKLKIYDKIGIAYEIDLDKMEFVVQKKAELFFPYLERRLKTGGREETKQLLSAFCSLLRTRNQKGIADKDPNIKINFGFADGFPIQIDIGRFEKLSSSLPLSEEQEEIAHIVQPLNEWLELRDPKLASDLQEIISNKTL